MSVIGLRVVDKTVQKNQEALYLCTYTAKSHQGNGVYAAFCIPKACLRLVILTCCRSELLVLFWAFHYLKLRLREETKACHHRQNTLTNYREMNYREQCKKDPEQILKVVSSAHTYVRTYCSRGFNAKFFFTPWRIWQACKGSWQTLKCHHLLTLTFDQSFCHSFS